MPRRSHVNKEYLVARPAGIAGLVIPPLSEEECHASGIEPAKWPPRETWTHEQRDAADRLADILQPHVIQRHFLSFSRNLIEYQPALSSPNPRRNKRPRAAASN
jgi:hypothetical protein